MALPLGLWAAGMIGAFGLTVIILRARSFRRTAVYFDPSQSLTTSPGPTPAALTARLAGSRFAFLGALFDLTARGVLVIEEGPKRYGRHSFNVVRQPNGVRLQPYEQIFMDALFHPGRNEPAAYASLAAIASLAYNPLFLQALDQALTDAGWRDARRVERRRRFQALSGMDLGVGLAVLSVGLLLDSELSLLTNPWAFILGAVLIGAGAAESVMGLAGLGVASLISTLSDEGYRHASYWKSFSGYLRNITHGRVTRVTPDIFERYLPYAAGFGMATEWAQYFQKVVDIPAPAWFHAWYPARADGSTIATIAAITAADSLATTAAG